MDPYHLPPLKLELKDDLLRPVRVQRVVNRLCPVIKNVLNLFNAFNVFNMFNVFNVFNVFSIVSVLMLRIFSSFPPHLLISSSNKENLLLQIFTKSFQNFLYSAFWKTPLAEHKVSYRVVGLPVYKEPTAGPVLEKIEGFQ